jgi:hypothetical protein
MRTYAKLVKRICGCLIAFLSCYLLAPDTVAAGAPLTLTVDVSTNTNAGIGFGHLTDATLFDLIVKLTTTGNDKLAQSHVFDQGGRLLFYKYDPLVSQGSWDTIITGGGATAHSYKAAGVKANYGHSARFEGNFVRAGGVAGAGSRTGTNKDFEAKLSDVDLDVDSDNNGDVALHRPPSESDYEDHVETYTGSASPEIPMGLGAAVNDVVMVKAKLRKKKDGTFAVGPSDVKFYTDADAAANGTPSTKEVDWSSTGASGTIGYMKVTSATVLTATFTPNAAGGRQGVGSDTTGKSEDKVNIFLNNGAVTFSPNPIVTGCSLPLATSTIHKTVVATVIPPASAADLNFRVKQGTQPRVIISVTNRDTTSGKVTFDVTVSASGTGGTPPSAPYGDTTVEAYTSSTNVLGSLQAIVVVPWKIASPHPQDSGVVTGTNACCSRGTSPCFSDVPVDKVKRATFYVQWQTITVADQFGNTTDRVYEGTPVEEYISEWIAIHQNLSDLGTYRDPVGSNTPREVPPVLVKPDSADARAWLTAPLLPITTGAWTNDMSIKVAGHILDRGIVGRRMTATADGQVNIVWPEHP